MTDLVSAVTRPLRLGVAALTTCALLGGAGCAAPHQTRVADPDAGTASADLRHTLQDLESSYDGRNGAVGIDLDTGKTVGYRAGERFPLNSSEPLGPARAPPDPVAAGRHP